MTTIAKKVNILESLLSFKPAYMVEGGESPHYNIPDPGTVPERELPPPPAVSPRTTRRMEEEGHHRYLGDSDSFIQGPGPDQSFKDLTSKLSTTKMVLHDACKMVSYQSVSRRKFKKE